MTNLHVLKSLTFTGYCASNFLAALSGGHLIAGGTNQKRPLLSQGPFLISRDGGIRTHDLQHPMLARYLATLQPEIERQT